MPGVKAGLDALRKAGKKRLARAKEQGHSGGGYYHGSDETFAAFDPSTGRRSSTRGHYFTGGPGDDAGAAEYAASGYGSNVREYSIRTGKNLDLTEIGPDNYDEIRGIWKEYVDEPADLVDVLDNDGADALARALPSNKARELSDHIERIEGGPDFDGWHWVEEDDLPPVFQEALESKGFNDWAEKISSPAGYNEEFGPGFRDNVFAALEQKGYDSVSLWDDAPGGGATVSTVVFDPANIRLPEAQFKDPTSRNLLASATGATVLAGAAPEEAEAGPIRSTLNMVKDYFHIAMPGKYGDRAVEVIKNPTSTDYQRFAKEVRDEFPQIQPGEPKTRFTVDEEGNRYIWKAHEAIHGQMDPKISEKVGLGVNQGNPEGRTVLEAFHGSPHKFDKFSMDKIGTGEGAQAYGHGLYFADRKSTAKYYKEALARDQARLIGPDGSGVSPEFFEKELFVAVASDMSEPLSQYTMHEIAQTVANGVMAGDDLDHFAKFVRESDWDEPVKEAYDLAISRARVYDTIIPEGGLYRAEIDIDPDTLLDWDKPLSEQSEAVQKTLRENWPMSGTFDEWAEEGMTGQNLHDIAAVEARDVGQGGNYQGIAERLNEAGIPGIRYLDQMSRTSDKASQIISAQGSRQAALDLAQKRLDGVELGDSAGRSHWQNMVDELGKSESSNYVMFDDAPISIKERGYADPTLLMATAAAAHFTQSYRSKQPMWQKLKSELSEMIGDSVAFQAAIMVSDLDPMEELQKLDYPLRAFGAGMSTVGNVATGQLDQVAPDAQQIWNQDTSQTFNPWGDQVHDAISDRAGNSAMAHGIADLLGGGIKAFPYVSPF